MQDAHDRHRCGLCSDWAWLAESGAVAMAVDNYTAILDDTARRLDAIKPEIDALCAQAHAHIEQRYRDALEELRRNFLASS